MSKYTQIERDGLFELTDVARAELSSSKYYNEDLAPTSISQRTWTTYHISMLWVGMSVCIPSFTMASGLVGLGSVSYTHLTLPTILRVYISVVGVSLKKKN